MSPDCRQSPGLNTIPSNTRNEAAPYVCTVIAKDVCNITLTFSLLTKSNWQYLTSQFVRNSSYFLAFIEKRTALEQRTKGAIQCSHHFPMATSPTSPSQSSTKFLRPSIAAPLPPATSSMAMSSPPTWMPPATAGWSRKAQTWKILTFFSKSKTVQVFNDYVLGHETFSSFCPGVLGHIPPGSDIDVSPA